MAEYLGLPSTEPTLHRRKTSSTSDSELKERCLAAFKAGDKETGVRLLRSLEDPFEVTDENGATLAHLAAKNGWADVLDKELCKGRRSDERTFAFLRQKDRRGKTPLQYASEHKQLKVVALLFAASIAEKNPNRGDEFDFDSLVAAAPGLLQEVLPAAGPLASLLPAVLGGRGTDCGRCEVLEKQVTNREEQVEVLAKQCLGKEKENDRLQKKLKQLQVSDLPDVMEAAADVQTQWKELGHALGISEEKLEDISSNKSHGELHYLYEMLRHWVMDIGATWGSLVGAMRSSYVKQDDLAAELEKKHSGQSDPIQVHTVTKDEKPLEDADSEVEAITKEVFGSEQAHIDWKVLGLMLGLTDSTLESIQPTPEGCEKAMLRHWIKSGKAYYSVLVDAIAGPVIDERRVARDIAKRFLKLDLFGVDTLEDGILVSEESIEKKNQDILNAYNAHATAIGIVFLIGVGDVAGTDIDGENISKTFRNLGFFVYRVENSSRVELSCLVKTVAFGNCFSRKCKYVAFYYAGHGGIDERGDPFMKVKDGKEGRFYINRNMLAHFEKNKVNKKRCCLFFFDCCLSSDPKHESGRRYYPQVPIRCLVAYATSVGLKSLGDSYEGGIWTRKLCENLKEKLSVSEILDHTHTAVGDDQPSVYISSAGAIFLKGIRTYSADDSADVSNPVKIWQRHSKELQDLLKSDRMVLISLCAGLHFENIIDQVANSKVLRPSDFLNDMIEALKNELNPCPGLLCTDSAKALVSAVMKCIKSEAALLQSNDLLIVAEALMEMLRSRPALCQSNAPPEGRIVEELKENSKLKLKSDDVKFLFIAVVSAIQTNPEFLQSNDVQVVVRATKDKLSSNPELLLPEGHVVIVDAVMNKLVSTPELLHKVLDIMDKQDLLCGLVRRMRRELGALQEKPKNILKEYHDEILQILHTEADTTTLISLCAKLLSQDLIDGQTFHDVTEEPLTNGPGILLKCLEEKVSKERSSLGKILDVMETEKPLREIVEKIRGALEKEPDGAVQLPMTIGKPQQVIEQLQQENKLLENENRRLIQYQSYKMLRIPLAVFFVTMSLYFITRRFR